LRGRLDADPLELTPADLERNLVELARRFLLEAEE
jgi:hypothetical protein